MQTKTQKLVDAYRFGDIKNAVKILSSFSIGISKEDKRILEIAKDLNAGHTSMYLQIGIVPDEVQAKAREILKTYVSKIIN